MRPTINLFRAFYHTSWSNGWVTFSKRPGRYQCYTDKVDALRGWRERFFWIDDKVFTTLSVIYTQGGLLKDEHPDPGTYNVEDEETINSNRILINSYPEEFLVHMGMSRNYFGGFDEVPTFWIRAVWVGACPLVSSHLKCKPSFAL